MLASRVRFEERRILEYLEASSIPHVYVDDRTLAGGCGAALPAFRVVINRCLSYWRSVYAARLLEGSGNRVVNGSAVASTCGDKILTSLVLARAGIRSPRTIVALTAASALEAIEQLGYPVVLKPPVGSWGRLVSKVNDRDAAEALLEHRDLLASPQQKIVYVQEFVEHDDGDIRAIVVGGEVVGAVLRSSSRWRANVAQGATTSALCVTDDVAEAARGAAAAVGGGAVAVDLIRARSGELFVTEVNHNLEFRGFVDATGIDVARAVVEFALAEAS